MELCRFFCSFLRNDSLNFFLGQMFFPANIEKFEYISHRISEKNK